MTGRNIRQLNKINARGLKESQMSSLADVHDTIVMKRRCKCEWQLGFVKHNFGTDCVYCVNCRKFQYSLDQHEEKQMPKKRKESCETLCMRSACKCGSSDGYIRRKNGQDCVYCDRCNTYQYNRPKSERAREPSPVEKCDGCGEEIVTGDYDRFCEKCLHAAKNPWGRECRGCGQVTNDRMPAGLCDRCEGAGWTVCEKCGGQSYMPSGPDHPDICLGCLKHAREMNHQEPEVENDIEVSVIDGRRMSFRKVSNKAKSEKLAPGVEQVPFEGIEAIGEIFSEGAVKYGVDNWKKGVGDKDYQTERCRHAIRHLMLWANGDRSENHLAKVAWFCVTQIWIQKNDAANKE